MNHLFSACAQWQQYLVNLYRTQSFKGNSQPELSTSIERIIETITAELIAFEANSPPTKRSEYPNEARIERYSRPLGESGRVYSKAQTLLTDWLATKGVNADVEQEFSQVLAGKLKDVSLLDAIDLDLFQNNAYDVLKMAFHGDDHSARELIAFGSLEFNTQSLPVKWFLKKLGREVTHHAAGALYLKNDELRVNIQIVTGATGRRRRMLIAGEQLNIDRNRYRWGIVQSKTPPSSDPSHDIPVWTKICLVLRENDHSSQYFEDLPWTFDFLHIEKSPERLIDLIKEDEENFNPFFMGDDGQDILSRIFAELKGTSETSIKHSGLLFLDGNEDRRILD